MIDNRIINIIEELRCRTNQRIKDIQKSFLPKIYSNNFEIIDNENFLQKLYNGLFHNIITSENKPYMDITQFNEPFRFSKFGSIIRIPDILVQDLGINITNDIMWKPLKNAVDENIINPILLFINKSVVKWSNIYLVRDYTSYYLLLNYKIDISSTIDIINIPYKVIYSETGELQKDRTVMFSFTDDGKYTSVLNDAKIIISVPDDKLHVYNINTLSFSLFKLPIDSKYRTFSDNYIFFNSSDGLLKTPEFKIYPFNILKIDDYVNTKGVLFYIDPYIESVENIKIPINKNYIISMLTAYNNNQDVQPYLEALLGNLEFDFSKPSYEMNIENALKDIFEYNPLLIKDAFDSDVEIYTMSGKDVIENIGSSSGTYTGICSVGENNKNCNVMIFKNGFLINNTIKYDKNKFSIHFTNVVDDDIFEFMYFKKTNNIELTITPNRKFSVTGENITKLIDISTSNRNSVSEYIDGIIMFKNGEILLDSISYDIDNFSIELNDVQESDIFAMSYFSLLDNIIEFKPELYILSGKDIIEKMGNTSGLFTNIVSYNDDNNCKLEVYKNTNLITEINIENINNGDIIDLRYLSDILSDDILLEELILYSSDIKNPEFPNMVHSDYTKFNIDYDVVNEKIVLDEFYDNKEITMISKYKFCQKSIPITQEGYKVELGSEFAYCPNQLQFMVFLNGRKINNDSYFITSMKSTRPFSRVYLYSRYLLNPGDILDIFYTPIEMNGLFSSSFTEIETHEIAFGSKTINYNLPYVDFLYDDNKIEFNHKDGTKADVTISESENKLTLNDWEDRVTATIKKIYKDGSYDEDETIIFDRKSKIYNLPDDFIDDGNSLEFYDNKGNELDVSIVDNGLNSEDKLVTQFVLNDWDERVKIDITLSYIKKPSLTNKGYFYANKDKLEYPLSRDIYMVFINGKKIPRDSLVDISSNIIAFKEDTYSNKNIIFYKYKNDLPDISGMMNKFHSEWDSDIIRLCSEDELDKLFNIFTNITENANSYRITDFDRLPMINEVIRDNWMAPGINYGIPISYDYETDMFLCQDSNGNWILPSMDATQYIHIMKEANSEYPEPCEILKPVIMDNIIISPSRTVITIPISNVYLDNDDSNDRNRTEFDFDKLICQNIDIKKKELKGYNIVIYVDEYTANTIEDDDVQICFDTGFMKNIADEIYYTGNKESEHKEINIKVDLPPEPIIKEYMVNSDSNKVFIYLENANQIGYSTSLALNTDTGRYNIESNIRILDQNIVNDRLILDLDTSVGGDYTINIGQNLISNTGNRKRYYGTTWNSKGVEIPVNVSLNYYWGEIGDIYCREPAHISEEVFRKQLLDETNSFQLYNNLKEIPTLFEGTPNNKKLNQWWIILIATHRTEAVNRIKNYNWYQFDSVMNDYVPINKKSTPEYNGVIKLYDVEYYYSAIQLASNNPVQFKE